MKTIKQIRELSDSELRDIIISTKRDIINKNIINSFKGVQSTDDALIVAQTFINAHNERDYGAYIYFTDEEFETTKVLAKIVINERKQ